MTNVVSLVSYPRSGSTWLRFLLMGIQHPTVPVSYIALNKYVPDMHQDFPGHLKQLSKKELKIWGKKYAWKPLIVKAHFQHASWYTKVIYIYRDVRDVLLSYYYFYNQGRISAGQTTEWISFDKFFDKFLKGTFFSGGWGEHVNFWLSFATVERDLISYEELHKDTFGVLKKVVTFLGLDADDDLLRQAIDKVSFSKIIQVASRDGQHSNLRGLTGMVGGWKEKFSEDQLDRLRERFGSVAKKAGYNI